MFGVFILLCVVCVVSSKSKTPNDADVKPLGKTVVGVLVKKHELDDADMSELLNKIDVRRLVKDLESGDVDMEMYRNAEVGKLIKELESGDVNIKTPRKRDAVVLVKTLESLLLRLNTVSYALMEATQASLIDRCPSTWTEINSTCFNIPLYWKLDWSQAQQSCQSMGGHLANFESSSRGLEIMAILNETLEVMLDDVWVGGFGFLTDSSWFMANGEPVGVSADWKTFDGVEVIERNAYHRCLAFSNQLYAKPCFAKLHFVCEMEMV